jgi:hypothetical protein
MKPALLWLILAAAIAIALLLHRTRSAQQLNVTPDAREQIEKAKRR